MRTAEAVPGRERGVSPLRLGTLIFLASDLMLFAGLFAAYFTLRSQTHPWPPAGVELETTTAAVATLVLIASSGTLAIALRRTDARRRRRWIGATILLGAAFMALQVIDWFRLPFRISTNAYGTLFYTMTGVHWLHVLTGVVLMVIVVVGRRTPARSSGGTRSERRPEVGPHDATEAVAYFWHFVDVVWVALFATLFLLR